MWSTLISPAFLIQRPAADMKGGGAAAKTIYAAICTHCASDHRHRGMCGCMCGPDNFIIIVLPLPCIPI